MTASTLIKKYSESDLIRQHAKYLFRIKNLVNKQNVPIDEIGECLDYFMHLNSRDTLKIDYLNEYGLNLTDKPIEEIRESGMDYLKEIIEPKNRKYNLPLIKHFSKTNDNKAYFTYFQNIRNKIESDYTWKITSRCIVNKKHFLSITFDLNGLEKLNIQSDNHLEPDIELEKHFLILQTLTKREKEILSLVGQGFSSKAISEMLCISIFTVCVHRKNILKKLLIKNNAHLYRMAALLDRL
jgi:DNA-binding CsgD family transcriptional regulator